MIISDTKILNSLYSDIIKDNSCTNKCSTCSSFSYTGNEGLCSNEKIDIDSCLLIEEYYLNGFNIK